MKTNYVGVGIYDLKEKIFKKREITLILERERSEQREIQRVTEIESHKMHNQPQQQNALLCIYIHTPFISLHYKHSISSHGVGFGLASWVYRLCYALC